MRYGANDFLGEVLLELGSHPLDDEAEWYTLHGHQESNLHTVRIKRAICTPHIFILHILLHKDTNNCFPSHDLN